MLRVVRANVLNMHPKSHPYTLVEIDLLPAVSVDPILDTGSWFLHEDSVRDSAASRNPYAMVYLKSLVTLGPRELPG